MAFVDIPLDVLMEISRELDLPDSLHLFGTCTTFTPILLSRYFWIASLHRLERVHRRPPSCSPGLDILTLPLATLKELAIHAYKLRMNWSSESPSPVSVQTIKMEDSVKDLIPIQGTRLIITVSSSRLACWDTVTGECMSTFHHAAEPREVDGIFPFLRPGLCSIGMVYASSSANTFELAIICFDYRQLSAVHVSKVFSKTWTPLDTKDYFVADITLDQNNIAVIIESEGDMAFMLICRLKDEIIREVPLGIDYDDGSAPKCIIVEDNFYITRQYFSAPRADIIHVQTSPVHPHTFDFQIRRMTTSLPYSTDEPTNGTALGFCNLRFPKYGVLNVTLRTAHLSEDITGVINSLYFWPAEHDGSTLSMGTVCFYEHPCDIVHIAVGSSATCGITLDQARTVGLIQYLLHPTPHIKFQRLVVPEPSQAPDVAMISMALDDRLGVLYMGYHSEGTYHLSVVSYM